jgi:catechol 2,3-dioxygenase-like lactoylglutathione lyase family enzyme
MPSNNIWWRMPVVNFENLKKQAKQVVRWHREGYYPVAQRIRIALPRYRELDDRAILSEPFSLTDAQELIARELGFESWESLRARDGTIQPSTEQRPEGNGPYLVSAHPQVFVADVEIACQFFVETLGFTLSFKYGRRAFYAQVQRDGARLNLRFVHKPVLDREAESDLLSASISVEDIKSLYLEYRTAGAPIYQVLKRQPWGLRDFIVRDPDGNLIHFSE